MTINPVARNEKESELILLHWALDMLYTMLRSEENEKAECLSFRRNVFHPINIGGGQASSVELHRMQTSHFEKYLIIYSSFRLQAVRVGIALTQRDNVPLPSRHIRLD